MILVRRCTLVSLLAAFCLCRSTTIQAQSSNLRQLLARGETLDSLGHAAEALSVYRDAAARVTTDTPDSLKRAIFLDLGAAEYQAHSPQEAVRWFGRAAEVEATGVGVRERGIALLNLAAAADAADELDVADASSREALGVFQETVDTSMLASAWNSVGMIRRKLGFKGEAAADLEQALIYARAEHNPLRESTIENNLGLIADDEAENARGPRGRAAADRAIRAYRASLASLALLPVTDSADRAQTLNNLGVAFRRHVLAGGPRSFLDSADQAYADAAKLQTDRLGLARLRQNQALIIRDRGDNAKAAAELERALTELRDAKDAWWAAVTLRELADTFRQMGATRHTVALDYYDSAATAFEQLSGQTGGDASRAAYEDQKAALSLYDHWILAAADTPGGTSACDAFVVAERARAQALRALMSAAAARRRPGEPAQQRAVASDPGLCHAPGRRALAYYETSDTLLVWLSDAQGDLKIARVSIGRDSLQALIGAARRALGVEATGASIDNGLVAKTTIAQVGKAHGDRSLVPDAPRPRPAADGGRAALVALSAALLPSTIRQRLPVTGDLLIIPHGNIALVPFAALQRSATDTSRLGALLNLAYAPSADVARLAESIPALPIRRGVKADVLIAGDPSMPEALDEAGRPGRLDPLPGARAEATSIAARLGVSALTGGQATERAVRSRLSSARIIHLATHGVVYNSDARAEDSFIALAASVTTGKGTPPAPDADGHLTVRELLADSTLNLQADLVVLSACETALGRLHQSEGTLGLQRAFLARGARSVLVSLWRVDDKATRLLMDRFYAYWFDEHKTKAEALRRAQQDVRDAGYTAPRFWSAFQLVGAA